MLIDQRPYTKYVNWRVCSPAFAADEMTFRLCSGRSAFFSHSTQQARDTPQHLLIRDSIGPFRI